MCGRYQLTVDPQQLGMAFTREGRQPVEVEPFTPRFNIAPTQRVPVVRADGRALTIRLLRWGLVPHWAKDLKIGARMINARSETVADKPAFRSPFKRRRCLVPATGFYEWKRQGKVKLPHLIRVREADVFAMAGIWSHWRPKDDPDEAAPIETFSVLTCDPQGALGDLHHRMPVILHPDHWSRWLDPDAERAALLELARGTPAEVLEIRRVSQAVNSVRNEGPALVEPPEDDAPA